MNIVNYGTDPTGVEESQIANRLRLAQMMQSQAMDGPVYSDRAGIAKMLTSILAGQRAMGAEKEQRDLAARKEAGRKGEIEAIFKATEGTPAYLSPGMPQKDDEGNAMPGSMAKPPDRMSLARLLSGSGDPQLRQTGLSLMLKGPEKPEAFTLKLGEKRFVGDKVVAEAPMAPEKEPEAIRALKMQMQSAGIDPNSPAGQAVFRKYLEKTTTHQPAASMTVNTGKKFGETLAANVAEQVAQSAELARGAVGTLGTVKQITDALDSGKVMAGPGTSAIMLVQQAIGAPSTEEGRVQTRKVIQGLSQMTLDSRKQLKGQGQVSDFEGRLLAKAASGDIDNLSVPEIRVILAAGTRLANGAITQHKTYLKHLQSNPDTQGLAPFYDIQAPAAGNPTVDDLLRQYGPKP